MVLLWLNEDEPFPQPPRTIDWTIDFDLLDTVPDPQSPEDEQLWNLSGPSVGPPAPTLIADASCRLDNVQFGPGNSRTGDVRSKFQKYAWSQDYPDVREIYVGHDLDGPLLRIRCKRFVPGAGDYLSESFESEDGEAKEVIEFPPFACIDADSEPMRRAMSRYLDDSIRRANKAIDSEITDELVFLTLDEARRYVRMRAGCPSETSTIVASALKILAASYVSEDQPAIIHGDTLGIPLVDNRKLKQHNQRLIPISLDYQIDNLYIAYMKRHLDHVGPGLKQLIYKAKKNERKETWYEIFLTTFVLLLNLELVLDKQTRFVRKYKETNANAFVFATKTQMAMIEEWRASAKNLIYHYRCVVRGMDPFGQEWTREMQKEAKLDDESLAIVQKLSQIIAMRRDELNGLAEKDLDNDEATPLLWVTRLFAQDLVLIFSSPVTDCINSTTPLKLGRPSTRARNRCRPALEHFPRRNAHKCFAH
ncbi:uncharacterized protein BDV17DRAFT_290979 [Aspergillus undulatus]|uniref:uncharacterized protein n=1 Tax=Aspergillus undulatus TaxID=1810928 RepID=UPI003CCCF179